MIFPDTLRITGYRSGQCCHCSTLAAQSRLVIKFADVAPNRNASECMQHQQHDPGPDSSMTHRINHISIDTSSIASVAVSSIQGKLRLIHAIQIPSCILLCLERVNSLMGMDHSICVHIFDLLMPIQSFKLGWRQLHTSVSQLYPLNRKALQLARTLPMKRSPCKHCRICGHIACQLSKANCIAFQDPRLKLLAVAGGCACVVDEQLHCIVHAEQDVQALEKYAHGETSGLPKVRTVF